MSEIERAIEAVEVWIKTANFDEPLPVYQTILNSLNESLEREKNEPLSYSEILSMKRKPVYIVSKHERPKWMITWQLYENKRFLLGYGESWLAYRYEPKGEKTNV